MTGTTRPRGVLYLVACAAPAAAEAHIFVPLAQRAGWSVHVIATPLAMRFLDVARLEHLTDDPVRWQFRMPGTVKQLPAADAVVVAPATFNTINKWATGVADTLAVSLLCEHTGRATPILAVPLVKDALARHRAFRRSLDDLRAMGVRILFDPHAPAHARMPPWTRVLDELHGLVGS